jgi:hypothetical protein
VPPRARSLRAAVPAAGAWSSSGSARVLQSDFSQRFTGTFSDDGKTWKRDFDLTYTETK